MKHYTSLLNNSIQDAKCHCMQKNLHRINFKCSENASPITRLFSQQQFYKKYCFPEVVWGKQQAPTPNDLLARLQSLAHADKSLEVEMGSCGFPIHVQDWEARIQKNYRWV